MTERRSIILITGTTSGIGRGLLKFYREAGLRLITVNRREISDELHEGVNSFVLDITNEHDVGMLFNELSETSAIPDVFILNAGINKIDNVTGLNYRAFKDVMDTNFMGVMTFVGEIQRRNLKGRSVVALSSTSNIIANPSHLGYHLSKQNLHRAFRIFAQSDSVNRYKSVILGPVHTNITANSPPLSGLNKRIFDLLAVSVKQAADAITHFIDGDRTTLHYPRFAVLFYHFARVVLICLPGLYLGTRIPAEGDTGEEDTR